MARTPYYVSYIPGLKAAGMSANQALAFLKEQGLGARRQNFLRAWGEAQAVIDRAPSVATARLDRRPDASEVTPLQTVRATGFRTTVDVAVRSSQTGGIHFTPISVRTDRLVAYDEAIQMAVGALQAGLDAQGDYEFDAVYGGIVTEVRDLQPADLFE